MSEKTSNKSSGTAATINKEPSSVRRRPAMRTSSARSLLAYGEPVVWLTGGALVLSVVMILALLILVTVIGLKTFVTRPLLQVELRDGRILMGELERQEMFRVQADILASEPEAVQVHVIDQLASAAGGLSELPRLIRERRDKLKTEVEQAEERLAIAKSRIQSINEGQWISTDPTQRKQLIISDPRTKKLKELRSLAASLEQRIAGLMAEVMAAEEAVAHFDDAANQTTKQILGSEVPLRNAGINALVALASEESGEDAVRFRRRLLRTGNYDLTNEHFDWVADYQIVDGGETHPQHAVLVERTSWGRFYGKPDRFVTIHRRIPSEEESELEQLLNHWEAHGSSIDEELRAKRVEKTEIVRADLAQLRAKAVAKFVERINRELPEGFGATLVLVDGQTKSVDELLDEDDVRAVHWITEDVNQTWQSFVEIHPEVLKREHQAKHLEKHALGREYEEQEHARLAVRQAELDHDVTLLETTDGYLAARQMVDDLEVQLAQAKAVLERAQQRYPRDETLLSVADAIHIAATAPLNDLVAEQKSAMQAFANEIADAPERALETVNEFYDIHSKTNAESVKIQAEIAQLRDENERYQLHLVTADGVSKQLVAGEVVRAFQPNNLQASEGWQVYLSRWWEFLTDEPREANSEGGVMPAIWGTVVMTLLMSVAVVPFGVMAALYLREYAKAGAVVSVIRIAINNLAGVPSIVFGVFGWGFFCLIIGAYVDGGPKNASFETLPTVRWYFAMGILVGIAFASFLTGVIALSGPVGTRQAWKRWVGYGSAIGWVIATCLFFYLVFKTPFFNGFYEAKLPSPSWGKPGVVWAALTLSLMTLPVVIVATEEALAAVPNSMRQGSYGCGASKWQTIRRIVLPHAMPGIMTGMILAMARGAGEVAPLMLTGAVKLAPDLPLDGYFPYLHGSRSFMHLGFHIYDVGFQSQNSEAAKPMVYTTTLLLIAIVTLLNLLAVWLRAYLRKRFVSGQF